MVDDPGMKKGFVWGQIYIVLSIVLGIVGVIWAIMAYVGNSGELGGATPGEETAVATVTLVFSILYILGGIGLYGRWKWGLYLTYFLLGITILFAIWQLIAFFVFLGGAGLGAGIVTARIIAFVIHVLIASLWLGYFIRRRSWFH